MPNQIDSFLQQYPNWTNTIQNKHILFDTNAIMKIMLYEAETIMTVFKDKDAICCFIDPINIELQNTDNSKIRIQRQEFLTRHKFNKLPLDIKVLEKASEIQAWLSTQKIFPGVADLYLSGRLGSYSKNNILLLTANLSDFPYPLFKREAYILLQNNKGCTTLSLLSFNHNEI